MKSPLLNFRIITNKGVKQKYDNMFYTEAGVPIRNPEAYAATGAPMYERGSDRNINAPTTIYKAELDNNKVYVGKTEDFDRRCEQHFSGRGSKVTQKFSPRVIKAKEVVPGFFADDAEQAYTERYIEKYGYDRVRGGKYTNSNTLERERVCYRCGRNTHIASSCYARTHLDGRSL